MIHHQPHALWVLEVPEATPSLNEFAHKRGAFIYGRIRARWFRHLRSAWYVARSSSLVLAGWQAPPRARLTVHRFSPQAIDRDNLVGGLKPVIDALRTLGFIADDHPDALQLDVRPQRAPACSTLLVLEHWPSDEEAA